MIFSQKEVDFLRENFKEYYSRFSPCPEDVLSREAGFGVYKKIDFRHKAFKSDAEFKAFLTKEGPLFVSYSVSHYKYPAARPMQKKGRLGADLVFDLDALPKGHEHNKVFCKTCVERARQDALRLEGFLFSDFGFAKKEVSVNFSGSKGFHLHVDSELVLELSASARQKLVDYVSAQSLESDKFFPSVPKKKTAQVMDVSSDQLLGPSQSSRGWFKRVHNRAVEQLSKPDEELVGYLRTAGYSLKHAKSIALQKKSIVGDLKKGVGADSCFSVWDSFVQPEKLVAQTVLDQRVLGVEADRSVTFDLSRLIRLPNSLHGDTGLLAKSISSLSSFDALKDAVAFSDKKALKVVPLYSACFELANQGFEVEKGKGVELPLCAAVLLLCRKAAVLA
ncbi:MAG: DNA primase catalytic subunit PriS [Candidatus Micrarchaeia archaeon]